MIKIRKRNGVWQFRQRFSEDIDDSIPDVSTDKYVVPIRGDDEMKYIQQKIAFIMRSANNTWYDCQDGIDLRETILSCAETLNHYVKLTLEIIHGTSSIYYLQDGEIISKGNFGKVFCATPLIIQGENIRTILAHMNSGVWKVKKWVVPLSFKNMTDSRGEQVEIENEYLILISSNDRLIPFEQIEP